MTFSPYHGSDVSVEDAERVCESVRAKLGEDVDVSLVNGGQPVYYYIVSVE